MNITTSSKSERLKRIFTHNFREKFLAALCAAAVLMFAVCFKQVRQTYTFNIDTKTATDSVLVSQNASSIEVTVSGTFFDLRRISIENPVINFDFSNEKAGEISRTVSGKLFPAVFKNIEIETISPETLIWRTEAKVEKTVPVSIVFDGENAGEDYTVEPAEIGITGAESAVNGLEKINSEKIPEDAFTEKTEIEIPLIFPEFTASTDGTLKVKVTKKAVGDEAAEAQKNEENTEKTESGE